MAKPIEQAFRQKGAREVVLDINCPGGSPVQTSLIYKRIRLLAEEKKIKVSSFTQDVAASGGYWLACAGDKIYVDKTYEIYNPYLKIQNLYANLIASLQKCISSVL